jgi:hypothetical protein
MHAIANADRAQRAIGNALPERFHISSARKLQPRMAAPAFKPGGNDTAQHITRIAAAVRVQHWRIARAELRHAHRIGRHVQLLGDATKGRDKVARPRAGGPDDLDRACGTIHGCGCGDGAAGGDRLPIGGKSIGQSGISRRGIAPARVGDFGHA